MNFDFTDEQKLFAEAVRKFAMANLEAGSLARAHDPGFPFDIAALMSRQGLLGITIPEADGGQGDFVRRAMPWTAPKSLTNDEVYAVSAYVLRMNNIIGENEVMDAASQNAEPGRIHSAVPEQALVPPCRGPSGTASPMRPMAGAPPLCLMLLPRAWAKRCTVSLRGSGGHSTVSQWARSASAASVALLA
jgi:Acyl-CoA dehydrogenase, N-terminal domain